MQPARIPAVNYRHDVKIRKASINRWYQRFDETIYTKQAHKGQEQFDEIQKSSKLIQIRALTILAQTMELKDTKRHFYLCVSSFWFGKWMLQEIRKVERIVDEVGEPRLVKFEHFKENGTFTHYETRSSCSPHRNLYFTNVTEETKKS